MDIKKNKDNMYPWVDTKRNFIGGECPHRCGYCYVTRMKKRFPGVRNRYTGPLYLLERELSKNEGRGHMVFVQDCGDLFARGVPSDWIAKVLDHSGKYPGNTYLFQSKNPERFIEFSGRFPARTILGTTIETNRTNTLSLAPDIHDRARYIKVAREKGYRVMISIEPILDFDHDQFVQIIKDISPAFVSVGADSKGYGLPEPDGDKIKKLVEELKGFVEVRLKSNLKRLMHNC